MSAADEDVVNLTGPADASRIDIPIPPTVITYPEGDKLDGTDALAITWARPTRVVLVAGPANSGKTTLLSCLYERFHFGMFAGFRFAGSKTLVGFEKRCFHARR